MALLVIRAESYGKSNEKANYDSVFTTQSHILDDALQNCAPATDVTLLTLVTLITSIKKKSKLWFKDFQVTFNSNNRERNIPETRRKCSGWH